MSVKPYEELEQSKPTGIKLIGITGQKGAGKTTLYNGLYKTAVSHGMEVKRVRFSDPVAEILQTIVGDSSPIYNALEYRLDKQWVKRLPLGTGTVRTAMQKIGRLMREIDPQSILNHYTENLYDLLCTYESELVVITDDVRLAEEADLIMRHGGILIHLSRGEGGDSDPTEAGMKDYDRGYWIDNRGLTPEQTLEQAFGHINKTWNIE